jgi:hypothetical protein
MRNRILPIMMLIAALLLAATAAYYSVYGISKLFVSQAVAVIVMASILEISKLITAAYLERFWQTIHWIRKVYLITAMLILMSITSLGIYGFLVSAYQDTAYKMQSIEKLVEIETTNRLRYEQQINQNLTERVDLNTNISELTKGLSNNVITYTNKEGNIITTTSSSTRKALENQLELSRLRLADLISKESILNDSITQTDLRVLNIQTNSDVVAELGPLRYIATMTGRSVDQVVNWFILLFIVVFDPLAIILLISANKALSRFNESKSKTKIAEVPVEVAPNPNPQPSPLDQGIGNSPIADHRRNPSAVGSKWWNK